MIDKKLLEGAVELDLCGYRCPLPVVKMEAAIRQHPVGTRFHLLTDDPIAKVDIPHFARMAGYEARLLAENGQTCDFLVTALRENSNGLSG